MQDRLKISEPETRFTTLWDAAGGPELQREYRFAPPRRRRADFARTQARLLIEIEGGLRKRGRHLTPRGFAADAEKYPAATLQGWTVVRLVSMQLTPETVKQVLAYARDRVRISGEFMA